MKEKDENEVGGDTEGHSGGVQGHLQRFWSRRAPERSSSSTTLSMLEAEEEEAEESWDGDLGSGRCGNSRDPWN